MSKRRPADLSGITARLMLSPFSAPGLLVILREDAEALVAEVTHLRQALARTETLVQAAHAWTERPRRGVENIEELERRELELVIAYSRCRDDLRELLR